MRKLLPLLLGILIIISCASAAKERSLNELPDADFSVAIPNGWWKPQYTDKYLITKDGPYLQYVLIQRRPLEKSFRYTRKKMKSDMLPQEAAGIIVDELASDRFLTNFSVIDNTPARIDGQPGFKILFTYNDKKGAQFKTLYYGFISGGWFYNLRYCAAERHYYQKDIAEFEQIKNSFKVIDRTG
jgi:hypothetical protein